MLQLTPPLLVQCTKPVVLLQMCQQVMYHVCGQALTQRGPACPLLPYDASSCLHALAYIVSSLNHNFGCRYSVAAAAVMILLAPCVAVMPPDGMQAFAMAVHASSNSKHQLEVAQVLTDLGVKHTTNYLTDDGLFCADIMVQDHRVIIQVDEVHHWTVNTGQPIGK